MSNKIIQKKIKDIIDRKTVQELISEIYGAPNQTDYCHEWCQNVTCNKEHIDYLS